MTDVSASIGIVQLKKLKTCLLKKQKIAQNYNKFFKDSSKIKTPYLPDYVSQHSWYNYSIRVSSKYRNKLIKHLSDKNIETRLSFPPVHIQPYYKKQFNKERKNLRKSLKTFNEFLDIPIWPDMSFAKQKTVANAIINYLKKIIFMNILGVILARKGSKGIKNKNHLKLNGKSLINIAIKNAKNSKKITKLIFSTDDKKLRNEAIKLGINSPFLRPKN